MPSLRDQTDRILAELLAALRREAPNAADPAGVAHDLEVHQIELELQNRELRQAQQALEESRDRYVDLYDHAPVAYASLTGEGRITQLNLTAAQLLGIERARGEGLFLGTRLAPGDGRVLLSSLGRVLSTGEEESHEVGLGRPPATRRDLRLTIRRETPRPAEATPPTCRVILSDITEITQARAALLAERHFLQSVVDGVSDPIVVIGTDCRLLLMNQAARQAANVPVEGRCGLPCYSALNGRDAPCDSAEHPCPVPQVLAGGLPVKVVHRDLWADGRTHWIEVIGSRLLSHTGEVLGVIESSRDITEHLDLTARLQARELQLAHLAEHDPLTDLPNRILFADRLRQAMRHSHRERRKVALLFLDLDHFKSINDSLGHATGDLILQQAARRMRTLVREGDTVARMGGDEFTVILGALTQGSDAGLIAHKLIAAFDEPFEVADRLLYVTASIGLSLYPDDGTELETLVRNADSAMYCAKAQGRNTFRFYTEDMTAQALAQVALESDLRQALARAEFVLHYQSQIELATSRLVGCEALIRWQHPTLGLVEPGRFIPLAESTGLIVPISAWVVRTAAAQIKVWQDQDLLTDSAIWINLSGRDTQNPNLAATIAGICGEVGIDPGDLAVEITETWIMANPDVAAENIRRLEALGVAVGIDDFGTGYASLAALNRLAIREIKIDRALVAGLPADPGGRAIVRAVIALGQTLGLRIVAEGVETPAQADFLKAEGCGIGQGYLFSRPLPAAEFEICARGASRNGP
jgi:diguanylate cyclase (GGDEF)-like protein/PAS domain S-box-containing protein